MEHASMPCRNTLRPLPALLPAAVFALSLVPSSLPAQPIKASSGRDGMIQAVEKACLEMANPSCRLLSLERRILVDDIVEYSFLVRVGEHSQDTVGLHRVVRETGPWKPLELPDSLFLVHGDAWGFTGAFNLSASTTGAQPLAQYLADHDVDVWGVDLRWVNVPASVTDLSFMRGWDTAMHLTDVRTVVKAARNARASADGGAAMPLLGWSRGALIAYAYAGLETTLPDASRDLSGLVPVDYALLFDPANSGDRAAACARYDAYQAQLSAGIYHTPQGGFLRSLGSLAQSSPDQRSPFGAFFGVPDYTNLQMALYFGSETWEVYDATATYHYAGGLFDASGRPQDLAFTRRETFLAFLKGAAPYQSLGELRDGDALQCGREAQLAAMPYEDRLGQIGLPVLHLSAAGGFGPASLYSGTRLTSAQVTWLEVSEEETLTEEFGHTDLWQGIDAEALVWAPLLEWVQGH